MNRTDTLTLISALGLTFLASRLSAAPAFVEGVAAVFRSDNALGRDVRMLEFPAEIVGPGPSRVRFEIGFRTAETILDPGFLDSLTLSLTGGKAKDTAVLLTLDGFGAAPLPDSPGALVLPAAGLILTPTPPTPGLFTDPVGTFTQAFNGVWDLPSPFQNEVLTVYAEFFNNGNPLVSQGYLVIFRPQLIPEPGVWALGGLGFAVVGLARRAR